jgi:hypothetical protein
MADSRDLGIQADEPTSGALYQVERWATSPTGDVEGAAVRAKTEKLCNFGLLGGGSPALLPEVLTVYLAPQLGSEFAVEASILRAVEIEAGARAAFLLSSHSRPRSWRTFSR